MKNKATYILAVFVTLLAVAAWQLPIQELYSTLQFRYFPEAAKKAGFIRLTKNETNQIIYLLGTVHGRHFVKDFGYPYWELRSTIETLRPDKLILEIRPQEFVSGSWGESPAEMSYAAIIAEQAGIQVSGMDYWEKNRSSDADFEKREDKMTSLILSESNNKKISLVLTGYSHVPGLSRRLLRNGFRLDNSFESSEKNRLFKATQNSEVPKKYFELSEQAIQTVEKGKTDFNLGWASGRRQLLEEIRPK